MRSWSHSRTLTEDEETLAKIGDAAALAIEKVRGKKYRSGVFSYILYMSSGTSIDYFYGEHGIISFTPELGTSFVMPANEIIPIGKESFEALKVFGKFLIDPATKLPKKKIK